MTLTYPLLDKPLVFTENHTNSLVIEAPVELRRIMAELRSQINGDRGRFVLGIDHEPAELSRLAVMVSDPLELDLNARKLSARLMQEVLRAAGTRETQVRNLLLEINSLAAGISMDLDNDITYTPLEDPEGLLRLLDYHPDWDALSMPEQLLGYMRLQRAYFGKRLFILYGLKAVLTREELNGLLRSIRYEKLDVLLLDAFQRDIPAEGEELTIIDEDLCILR